MGKAGGPRDAAAWHEKRQLAKRLLASGVPVATVARQLGASKSWVQRVQQETAAHGLVEPGAAAS